MSFGERLRSAREKAEFTQAKLAEEAGITQGQVSAWERDRLTPVADTRLSRLAAALGVSLDWLIGGDEENAA